MPMRLLLLVSLLLNFYSSKCSPTGFLPLSSAEQKFTRLAIEAIQRCDAFCLLNAHVSILEAFIERSDCSIAYFKFIFNNYKTPEDILIRPQLCYFWRSLIFSSLPPFAAACPDKVESIFDHIIPKTGPAANPKARSDMFYSLEESRKILKDRLVAGVYGPKEGALEWAVRWGHTETVKQLFNTRMNLDPADKYSSQTKQQYRMAFGIAAENGHTEIVGFLLERGFDGSEALIKAAGSGQRKMVDYLHNLGVPLGCRNGEALVRASANGKSLMVYHLLRKNVDPSCQGGIALVAAAAGGHAHLIDKFIALQVDINCHNGRAILEAAKNGKLYTVRHLIGKGLGPHTQKYQALVEAASGNHMDVVEFLLSCMPDTAIKGTCASEKGSNAGAAASTLADQNTILAANAKSRALLKAASEGHKKIARRLIECHADVNYGDDEALFLAASNYNPEMIRLLVASGANVDARDGAALFMAARRGDMDTAMFLAEMGANVNAHDVHALRCAVKLGDVNAVRLLVERYNADMNSKDGRVLFFAAAHGKVQVIDYFLGRGMTLEGKEFHMIVHAVKGGHMDALKYLVEEKHISAGLNNSRTLSEAAQIRHPDIANYLLKMGADKRAAISYLKRKQDYAAAAFLQSLKCPDHVM